MNAVALEQALAELKTLLLYDGWLAKRLVVGDEDFWNKRPAVAEEKLPEEPESLESLKAFISECEKCGASREKKNGIGSGSNGVMVILHAPALIGRSEMQFYKKESTEILKRIITMGLGLEFKECYITNMIKCETDNLFIRPSQMAENCIGIIEKEISVLKPKLVIVMGDILPIRKIVNNSLILWFTIDHPISMAKTPDLKRKAWNTLKIAAAEIGRLRQA